MSYTPFYSNKEFTTGDPLHSPVMTYANGVLIGIAYGDGTTKTLTYTGGLLTQITQTRNGTVTRKTLTYAGGVLSRIAVETV